MAIIKEINKENSISKNTFKSRIKEIKVGNSFYLASIDNYTEYTDTIYKPMDRDFIQIYYCIKGNAVFHIKEDNLILKEQKSLIMFDLDENHIDISLQSKSKIFILVARKDSLEDILFDNIKNRDTPYKMVREIIEREKIALNHIYEGFIEERVKEFFVSLKVRELLVYSFFSFKKKDNLDNEIKEDRVKRIILEIREEIIDNIIFPPTLKELSQRKGLSEFKIKSGFKKMFGKTLSNFALDTKMEIAKDKLEMNVKKVKDIAFDIGYENPSHFIEAFKKKYGITPKQWIKK